MTVPGLPQATEAIIEKVLPRVTEEATERILPKVAEQAVETVIPKIAEETVERIVPKVAEETAERVLPKVAEETVEKVLPKVAEETVEKVIPKVAEQAVETVVPKVAEQAAERTTAQLADQALRYGGNLTADFAAVAARKAVDVAKYGVTTMPVFKTTLFAVSLYAGYRAMNIVGMSADKVESYFGPNNPNPPQPPEGSKTLELADGTTTIVRPERPEDKGRKDGIIDEESGKVMYPWNPEVDDFKANGLDSTVQWVSSWSKESPMLAKIALGALTFMGVSGIGGMVSPQNSGIISLLGIGLAIAAAYYGVDAINNRADAIAKHDNGLKSRFAEAAASGVGTTEVPPAVEQKKEKPEVPLSATPAPVPAT